MEASLIQILACPVCREEIVFEGTSSDGRLVDGIFKCSKKHLYQVKDGIPILKDPMSSSKEFEWEIEFPNLEKYEEIQSQYRSYLPEELKEADRTMILELAKTIAKESLILDVASGMGGLLTVLSQHLEMDGTILGIDVDEKPLRGAKLKLEKQKTFERVALCVMDGKHLALKPQQIPCATSNFGFDNIPETKKAFEEVHRVLIPRGCLAFTTLWLEEGSKSLSIAETHGLGEIATENRLVKTLEKTGFEIRSCKVFFSGKWPHNPMDLLPVEGDQFSHVMVTARKTVE